MKLAALILCLSLVLLSLPAHANVYIPTGSDTFIFLMLVLIVAYPAFFLPSVISGLFFHRRRALLLNFAAMLAMGLIITLANPYSVGAFSYILISSSFFGLLAFALSFIGREKWLALQETFNRLSWKMSAAAVFAAYAVAIAAIFAAFASAERSVTVFILMNIVSAFASIAIFYAVYKKAQALKKTEMKFDKRDSLYAAILFVIFVVFFALSLFVRI